jgi:hypothetical protein
MKYLVLFFINGYAMEEPQHETITMEQSSTAPSSSSLIKPSSDDPYYQGYTLDGVRLLDFVSHCISKDSQIAFAEKVGPIEWAKFATNFDKENAESYKLQMSMINQPEQLTGEQKSTLCINILSHALMYRCDTNNMHRTGKIQSLKQTQTYQRTSVASAIVGGLITIATNLLQHFLTKK